MFFSMDARHKFKEADPSLSFGDLATKISAAWKEMDAEAKQPFEEQAAADKERYKRDTAEYEAMTAAPTLTGPPQAPVLGTACCVDGCFLVGTLSCSRCSCARYCSKAHQLKHWKASHKAFCTAMIASTEGYPDSPITPDLYSDEAALGKLLTPRTQKDEKKLKRTLANSMILLEVRGEVAKQQEGAVVPTKEVFQSQFNAFTNDIFKDWGEAMWRNVFVAGGSVLGCLLPIPLGCEKMKTERSVHHEFNFRGKSNLKLVGTFALGGFEKRDASSFLFDSRFPQADVDVFIYGLSKEEATEKLESVLQAWTSTARARYGPNHDVLYVKTTNTTTCDLGTKYRKMQIITRLYPSPASVINSFDIDCCCVGYDGSSVMANSRSLEALALRINTVDLTIRSNTTENRLLKYAERGFAINVPNLDRRKVDKVRSRCTATS